jgi:hypothetical protein
MKLSSLFTKIKKKPNKIIMIISVIIGLFLILGAIGVWAELTRAGKIQNYLGIEDLCPAKQVTPPLTPSSSPDIAKKTKINCPPDLKPQQDCGVIGTGDGKTEVRCGEWKCVPLNYIPPVMKPVIYLYPTNPQPVNVKIKYKGDLTVTYPEYNNGWDVIAYPDGKIINTSDQKEYSYLFWEGKDKNAEYDLSTGFIVPGSETAEFLQDKLAKLGLTPKEYNEFIVYWLPQMQSNKYNLIHFATKEEYNDRAILDITPQPNSMLRVFMVFKKIDNNNLNINPQEIKSFERNGFAVIEWGGTEVK